MVCAQTGLWRKAAELSRVYVCVALPLQRFLPVVPISCVAWLLAAAAPGIPLAGKPCGAVATWASAAGCSVLEACFFLSLASPVLRVPRATCPADTGATQTGGVCSWRLCWGACALWLFVV